MTRKLKSFIALDSGSDVPMSEQLASQLSGAIADGLLRPGDRLPSIKEWKSALGVGAYIPRRALAILADRGAVDVRRHVGAVVVGCPAQRPEGKVVYISIDRGNVWARSVFSFRLGEELERAGARYGHVIIPAYRHDKRLGQSDFDLRPLHKALAEGISFAWCSGVDRFVTKPLADAGVPFAVDSAAGCDYPGAHSLFRPDMTSVTGQLIDALAAAGCRSVLHVGYGRWARDHMSSDLYAAGIDLRRLQIHPVDAPISPYCFQKAALDEFERMLSRRRNWLPDAFLFSDDYIAAGALLALTHHGIEAPRDVKVASFANKGLGPVYMRQLTRMENDPERNACEVARYIAAALSGRKASPPDTSVRFVKGETL